MYGVHITLLVINSFMSGHTHTHTDNLHRINFKKPGTCWHRPVHAWFKIHAAIMKLLPLQIFVISYHYPLICGWWQIYCTISTLPCNAALEQLCATASGLQGYKFITYMQLVCNYYLPIKLWTFGNTHHGLFETRH